jgi:hypothetical protein
MTSQNENNEQQEKEPILDVDGNVVTPTKIGPEGITQFGKLLIATLFGKGIKDDTPPDVRANMLAEIQAICLIRGIDKLNDDVNALDGDMASALTQYDKAVTGHLQSAANTLYGAEKAGEELSDADAAMLDFLKSAGVKHMPKRSSRRDARGPIAGLIQQLMRKQGEMSDEDFEASVHEQLDALLSTDKPTPGCDCPGCQMKKALLAKAKGSVVAEDDGRSGLTLEEMENHPDGVFAGLPGAKALRETREKADPSPEDAPPPTAVTAE